MIATAVHRLMHSTAWPLAVGLLLRAVASSAAGVVGDGTLDACTEAAFDAALAGGGEVRFACGGAATIAITATKRIAADTIIDGDGVVALSGQSLVRVLDVESDAQLTLRDVTVTDGFSAFEPGGGIRNRGRLMLDHVLVFGSVTIGFGGGLANEGEATISESMLAANRAKDGGGIANFGALTVRSSLFFDNVARYDPEGGNGGGIANYGRLTLASSTFSRNQAYSTGTAYTTGYGGALDNEGDATVLNCTMTRNGEYGVACGGLHNNGRLTLRNTLIALSRGSNCCYSVQGEFSADSGHNLTDDEYDLCGAATDRVSTPALRLRGLADNGGATLSVAIEPGSVAAGAGDPAACADAGGVDQRGRPRFGDGDDGCDIGALELPHPAPPTPTPAQTFLAMRGEPGEYIVGDREVRVEESEARFTSFHDDGSVSVELWGETFWYVSVAAPVGESLASGVYENAEGSDRDRPALYVSGNGNGCGQNRGRFAVREAVYAIDGTVERFAVDFEHHCGDNSPALLGSLRIASNLPPASPPTAAPTAPPTPTPRHCVGDCGGDGRLTIDDIVRGVRIALGDELLDACPTFDDDRDAVVGVSELVAAIAAALDGCRP